MKKIPTPQEALHKAAALCSSSEQCSTDIYNKLRTWGIQETEYESIIDRLIREKFLDDSRFCRGYVNDKFKFSKWGKIKIRFQLRQKRLDPTLIEEALSSIDETAYLDTLAGLLSEKNKTLKSDDAYSQNGRLFRFAASRGFEPEYILKILKTDAI